MKYIMQLDLAMFRYERPLVIFTHLLSTPEQDLLIMKKERTPFSVSSRFSDLGWVNQVKPVPINWGHRSDPKQLKGLLGFSRSLPVSYNLSGSRFMRETNIYDSQ